MDVIKTKTNQRNVRMSKELTEQIDALAMENNSTPSEIIRNILEMYMKNQGKEQIEDTIINKRINLIEEYLKKGILMVQTNTTNFKIFFDRFEVIKIDIKNHETNKVEPAIFLNLFEDEKKIFTTVLKIVNEIEVINISFKNDDGEWKIINNVLMINA